MRRAAVMPISIAIPPASSVTQIRHPGSSTSSAILAILDHTSRKSVTTKRSAATILSSLSTLRS
jgi:hypothetical protein